jgi:mannose-1-phosphate guanylyltransferase/mannose-6-phosphate isomerase
MLISALIINDCATVLDALRKIDANRRGFLVVVAEDMTFYRTLTDGDMRRFLIAGGSINDAVSKLEPREYATLRSDSDISEAIEIFGDSRIKFIPILGDNGKVENILTEHAMQVAFLRNLEFNLRFDFFSLEETALNHAIIAKPWGFFRTTVLNDFYQSKILSLNPDSAISLQLHKRREEYWLTVNGEGEAQIGESYKQLLTGSAIFIPRNCQHRLRNTSSANRLVVVEVQVGESFDEKDIERLDDDYGRTDPTAESRA